MTTKNQDKNIRKESQKDGDSGGDSGICVSFVLYIMTSVMHVQFKILC